MKEINVSIFRFDPEKDSNPRFESYRVPYTGKIRLIEIVEYIQNHYDTTLAFRSNCRAGRCGSDAVEADGKPVLACKFIVDAQKIVVSPLKIFPVVKDLVVDFSSAYNADIPAFSPVSDKGPWIMRQEEINQSRELRKCIECFICHDSCHVIRDHKADYIGPRFVVKAAALDKHPKDTLDRSRIMKEKGINLCNISRCCQDNCPEDIRITDDAIIYEREKIMDNSGVVVFIKNLFRRSK